MAARRLELPVEAFELVVHPVHVRPERAQLVAVGDVDVPEKSPEAIAASRESIRWIGPINDQERTNPSTRARPIAPAAADEEVPRSRTRALSAIRSLVFAVVELASTVASWLRSTARLRS